MDIRKLQRAIVDGLEDVKAQDIVVFNTEHLSPLFERVVIATANSARQTRALASSVRTAVKQAGFPVPRSEGEENGEWIIVDCGAAVAHVMQPGIRDYYHLEEIWGDKPVRMKLGGAAPRAAAAEISAPAGRKAPAGQSARGRGAARAAGKTPAVHTRAGKAAGAAGTPTGAGKTPAKRQPVTRSARVGTAGGVAATSRRTRAAPRKHPAGGPAAAPRPARKTASHKTASRKTASHKTASRKVAVRRTAAKTRAGAAE